jgi:hypothetical protein
LGSNIDMWFLFATNRPSFFRVADGANLIVTDATADVEAIGER